MEKIGITGTIAAGKTSFCILLKRRGFAVFNSDQYARMCLHASNPACQKLALAFPDAVSENGDIEPKKLADIIFHDESARKKVNAIVHPAVIEGMEKFFAGHSKDPFVFAEVPLLFEAGIQDHFDQIIVVTCSKDTAVERMMRDRGYTKEEALARYASQIAPEKQCAAADIVIQNNGTLNELGSEVNQLIRKLRERNRHAQG